MKRKNQKIRVLFLCYHNSGRSQMAEAFLRKINDSRFEVESAGVCASSLNPLAVNLMKEVGIDISRNRPKPVSELIKKGKTFDFIFVLISDLSTVKIWPPFAGSPKIYYCQSIEPLSVLSGGEKAKLNKGRHIRKQIQSFVERWAERIVI